MKKLKMIGSANGVSRRVEYFLVVLKTYNKNKNGDLYYVG